MMSLTEWKKLPMRRKKKVYQGVRAAVQIFYFLLLPSAFTASFNGVKYLFTQFGAKADFEVTAFVAALIALCLYTFVFGRFFCGFACAFGSLGDAVHALYLFLCKKCKKKPLRLHPKAARALSLIKYAVLLAIVLLCYAGAYGKFSGTSPWDVFSMIRAGNFRLGGYVIGVVLLLAILVGMCVQERFFCRFLCPMGAVFSLLPVLPHFSLRRRRENCIRGCSACTKQCPAGVELPADGSWEVCGDCFQCQKCIAVCPKGNIHCGVGALRGNEILFTLFRAALLFALLKWAGV